MPYLLPLNAEFFIKLSFILTKFFPHALSSSVLNQASKNNIDDTDNFIINQDKVNSAFDHIQHFSDVFSLGILLPDIDN